jgi:Tfp pilus assembly protein PilX
MLLYKSRGIVLIMVLIFLGVFALLSLYALQTIIWENKTTDLYWRKHKLILATDFALQQVEANIKNAHTNCMIPITAVSKLISQDWQSLSCTGNFSLFQYYYVIEFLGPEPCAQTGKKTIAAYYRITLMALQNPDTGMQVIMQSTTAEPEASSGNCREKIYNVTSGRQSLRLLV